MEINPIPGLTNTAVQVQSVWKSKIMTTDPPKYIPHEEYSLVYTLESEALILAVLFLKTPRDLMYQRFWRNAANNTLTISLSFSPHNWKESDLVQVRLFQNLQYQSGGIRLNVHESVLKHDPRDAVTNWTTNIPSIPAGALVPLTTIEGRIPLEASILLVVKGDTQSTHGRRRVKPTVSEYLPDSLAFLKNGRCEGWIVIQAPKDN